MDDHMLCRFLRARKFNVANAKLMLLKAESWRKDFGVESLTDYTPEEKVNVDKYYPQYYHKMDKEGRPIYIERLGQVKMNELRKFTTEDRQLQALVYEYEKFEQERLPACSAAVGHMVETSCTILDLKGVGVKAFWDVKNYVQSASKISQDYYPERMGKFYIINAPWGFQTVFGIVKGYLDPVTQEKIKVISGNGKKELLEQIDAENLPADIGGECKCPRSCSLSDAGPWQKTLKSPSD